MLMAKVRSSIFSVLLFCGANLGAQARSLQSEEQIIRSLQVGGRLEALAMKPTWDLYQDLTGCQKSELEIGQQMKPLCQVVVASKMCQEISPEDRLDCQTLEMEPQVGLWPFLAGCAQSLFKSVKDTLAFIWELVEWAFENISSEQARDQTSAQVSSYVQSIKLYLHNEFDKAYEEESPPFRTIKALMAMSEQLASMIYQLVVNYVQTEYQQLGCLNFTGKSEVVCGLMGQLATSGAFLALIQQGSKALKGFSYLKNLISNMKNKKKIQAVNHIQLSLIGKKRELRHVNPDNISDYLKTISNTDTAEVIYFPQSLVNNTAAGRNFHNTGHLGIRVNNDLMHINPDGITVIDFESYMRMRMVEKGQTAYGRVLQITPEEKAAILKTFNEKERYNLFVNNCAQKVCSALRDARIVDINKLLATDPVVVHQLIAAIDRPGQSTVYYATKQIPEITAGNLQLRLGAVAAVGGISLVGVGAWRLANAGDEMIAGEESITPEATSALIVENAIITGRAVPSAE